MVQNTKLRTLRELIFAVTNFRGWVLNMDFAGTNFRGRDPDNITFSVLGLAKKSTFG